VATVKNISVLFTDIVGSTELSMSLSVEENDRLLRTHFALLRQWVARSGGTEVKSLGDGLMAAFPTASGALACAVAMQQSVERDNRMEGRSVGLRVGISAGEATLERGDYYGDSVIEAARLCTQADGGQILVADVVRATAGRRTPYDFISLGNLRLKGLRDPVLTLEVAWEPAREELISERVPLPSRLEARPSPGVIGRESETALLLQALREAVAGDGRRVVLLAGEAGVGKTTLATQVAVSAYEMGAVVLLGRCEEDLGVPYGPFVEALSHYVAHADILELEGHCAVHGGELSRIVPALRRRLGDVPAPMSSDSDTERYLLYRAVAGLLEHVAAAHSLVLVLDDLQWADKPSLQMLRYVVANTTTAPILVVATLRDTELTPAHSLFDVLAALRREEGVSRVHLAGLDGAGVLAFIEATAGHPLGLEGDELARSLHLETDGNPFFVGEVLRHLAETGAIFRNDAGRWSSASESPGTIDLPSSVREILLARVARLGEPAGPVLAAACVIGRDFDLDLLTRVTETAEDVLIDVLDAAAASALVRELPDVAGRYSFCHALIQHSLYQEIGPTRRARLHRRVAEGIEQICGEDTAPRVAELAHHWLCAAEPVNDKAVEYAREAGKAALAVLAPDDALRYFSQALQLVELNPRADLLFHCDLRLGLGEAQRQAGMAAFRETFLQAAHQAEELGATDLLVRAALGNNRGFVSSIGSVDDERVAVLESSLDAVSREDSQERALLLATLCSELTYAGSPDRCQSLAADAKMMAARVGDPATIVRVLTLTQNAVLDPSSLAERTVDANEALALAEELGDPDLLYGACLHARINAMQSGDFDAASDHLAMMSQLSEQLRLPALLWHTAFSQATESLRLGDTERAQKLADAALQLGMESGQPDASVFYGGQLSMVYAQQGRIAELIPLFEQLIAENPGLGQLKQGLARAYLERGDEQQALELLEAGASDGFASLPRDLIWLFGMTAYADVAAQLQAEGPAGQLYALLVPYHDQYPFIAAACQDSPVATYVGGLAGVLGLYDEAEAYFAEAADLNARGSMVYAAARNDLAWARMLRARRAPGDQERALTLLARSSSAAVTMGYDFVARLVRSEQAKWL
jgi:class 3 adenylate cyclase/tetratricopeptide (TPR) repeat protein